MALEGFEVELPEFSKVKKVIGVVSGKGGVGKSLVTGLSACGMQKKGFNTAILDADITGPSIPKMFGIGKHKEADQDDESNEDHDTCDDQECEDHRRKRQCDVVNHCYRAL